EMVNEWLSNPGRGIEMPYYGFDHLRLVSASRGGHYRKWLSEQSPDALELLAPENALPDNRYVAPQAWRTSLPEELYPTSYIGGQCQEFLRHHAAQDSERPFFLQCSFPDPHHPFTPPGRYWDMYDPADIPLPPSFGDDLLSRLPDIPELREAFNASHSRGAYPYQVNEREARESIALTYGMISMVDDQVGELLALLDELGLVGNTVVIFTSDHGDYMSDHGLMLKLSLHYQGVLRVPFIWHDPAQPGGGAREAGMNGTLDIARTILDRAGLQPYFGIQGNSLLDTNVRHEGMLIEDYSLMYYFQPDGPNQMLTYVEPDWRLSVFQATDWGELYDLANDPHEMHNLWDDPAAQPQRARLTEAMIHEMMACRDHNYSPTSSA
ncbi:MAG: sulfatase-like hydrolase/transferase, partial [Rhodospirillales bacterium]|nr:sulfatase-like hydrolase/transferase [Rhodospirillales bacterium]